MLRTHTSRIIRLTVGLALLMAVLLVASPAKPAQAALVAPTDFCYLMQYSGATGTYSDPSGFVGKKLPFEMIVDYVLPNGQILNVYIIETSLAGGTTWNIKLIVTVSGCGDLVSFKDGRCNQDVDQSVAIYPDGTGGFFFFAIYKNAGFVPWHVSKATLDKYPARNPGYLMMQKNGIKLYRLPNGEIEAVRLKPDGGNYSFIMGTNCGVSHK
jgi:hypothetical protein